MDLIRPFVLQSMLSAIQFKVCHILGVHNEVAILYFVVSFSVFGPLYPRQTCNQHQYQSFSNRHFHAEFNKFFQGAIATNTGLAYETSRVEFDRFRVSSGLPLVWHPSDQYIIQFVVSCSLRGLLSASIRTYLSGISFK